MKFTCPKCNTRYSITDDKVPAGKTLRFTCKRCRNVIRLRRKQRESVAAATQTPGPQASTRVAPIAELERLKQATAPTPVGDALGASTRVVPLKEIDALRESARTGQPHVTAAPAGPAQPLQAASTRVAPVGEIERLRKQARTPKRTTTNARPVSHAQGANRARSAAAAAHVVAPKTEQVEAIGTPRTEQLEAVGLPRTEEVQGIERAPPSLPFAGANDWYVLVAGQQKGPLEHASIFKMLREKEIDRRTYAWRDGMNDWERLGNLDEFKEAAEHAGDAAWRVVRPKEGPITDESEPPPSRSNDEGVHDVMDVATVAMKQDQLRAELAKAREAIEEVPGRQSQRPGDVQVAASVAAAAAAYDRMDAKPKVVSELLSAPFEDEDDEHDEFSYSGENPIPLEARPSVDSGEFEGIPTDERPRRPSPTPYEDHDRDPAYADVDYLDRPPGENTRVFMAAGGLYRRRRVNRIAAVVGGGLALLLVATVSLDIAGVLTIPGMGLVYDMTGLVDPNVDRARERTAEALQSSNLSEEERKALRDRLLGLGGSPPPKKGGKKGKRRGTKAEASNMGVEEKGEMSSQERDLVSDIFASKKEQKVKLARPSDIRTPNLPDGLTQEAIFKVINESSRSMNLCYAQSMRAGEKVSGRMDVELTIGSKGTVDEARIETAQFQGSTFGNCTVKTIKRWRFPRFNGEPVTVIFPYMLSTGI